MNEIASRKQSESVNAEAHSLKISTKLANKSLDWMRFTEKLKIPGLETKEGMLPPDLQH